LEGDHTSPGSSRNGVDEVEVEVAGNGRLNKILVSSVIILTKKKDITYGKMDIE
jgi:hypothetical protein